jgi:hypothetical protein
LTDSARVRPAVPEDIPGLAALFQTVFHAPAPPPFWQWKYHSPAVKALAIVAEEEGRIVGHYGGLLLPYRLGRRQYLALQATDLMTHPSVRHRVGRHSVLLNCAGLFFDLARQAGADFAYGFPGRSSRLLGEKYLDYRPLQALEVEALAVEPGPLRLPAEPFSVLEGESEVLLARHAERQRTGVLRAPAYLRWRYAEHPSVTYHQARHRSAFLVFRLDGEAWLLDWAWEKERDLEEALRGVFASLEGLGYQGLYAWRVNGDPLPVKSARQKPAGFHLEYKPINSDIQEELAAKGWFTPGDYDAA